MKKNIKKITAILFSAIILLGLLAGCADSNNTSPGSSEGSVSTGVDSSAASSEGSGGTEGTTINLFTWEGMFPQEVLDGFTEETGIAINYVNFDFDENMLAKLQTAKGGDYDVIIADDYIIETAINEGLVAKLDKSKLDNFGNINPVYQGQFYDENNEYTVPYGAGVQTIVYNPNTTDVEIKGYADLLNPELKDNVGLIANYRVIDGLALKINGESYNTEDEAAIRKAGETLLELAPNVRLIKDDSLQDDLISGEVSAAVMYTSQVTMAKLAMPELEVVFPEEGIGFGIMANFVPVNAPNPEGAHKFIDYILRPEISAQCYEYFGYYCTNHAADDLISEDMKDFLTLPEDIDTAKMEMIGNISAEALEVHEQVWTEFKTASGQ